MTAGSGTLDGLLADAREAGAGERIEFRDPLAAHGDDAIEAMTDWLGDPRLAAFAIRVLERIGREPATKQTVIDVLRAVDRDQLPPHHAGDVERALAALDPPRAGGTGTRRTPTAPRVPSSPGVAGRGYWVMRTSQWERPFVWAEAQRGRLRQGWGWTDEMNLDVIAEVRRTGGELSDDQQLAVRSRRMRTSEPGGMRVGDLVVAPNLPDWGRLSVFRVADSYRYEMIEPHGIERFGHILPVELLLGDVDRRSPRVSDALRAKLRPQPRLFSIRNAGGEVERLLGNEVPRGTTTGKRDNAPWTETDYGVLFGRFPATGDRPTEEGAAALAAELGRTVDAITRQWSDGHAWCSGRSASTTSDALKAWLDRTGACGR